jgi:hypothetical protein
MKVRCELWVRLKVVDLVVQTAWITLTEKLGLEGELLGLARYSYWGMELEGAGAGPILSETQRAVRMDSAFTNQNKHRYALRVEGGPSSGDLALDKDYPVLAGGSGGGGGYAVDCLVRELDGGREEGYRDRLDSRLEGVRVRGMVAGEVWRLLVRARNEEEAIGRVERIAVTRSRREGLLLNPHYQRFEILSVARL